MPPEHSIPIYTTYIQHTYLIFGQKLVPSRNPDNKYDFYIHLQLKNILFIEKIKPSSALKILQNRMKNIHVHRFQCLTNKAIEIVLELSNGCAGGLFTG